MRQYVSRLTDTVTVHAADQHRHIRPGDLVDLDEVVGGSTLGAHLGPRLAGFDAVSDPAIPAPAIAARRRTPASEESES